MSTNGRAPKTASAGPTVRLPFRELRPEPIPTPRRAMPEPVQHIYIGPPLKDQTSLAPPSTWQPTDEPWIEPRPEPARGRRPRGERTQPPGAAAALALGRRTRPNSLTGKARAILQRHKRWMTLEEVRDQLATPGALPELPPRSQVAAILSGFVARGFARAGGPQGERRYKWKETD